MPKKWKVFLTMEYSAEVEAETEEKAVENLQAYVFYGGIRNPAIWENINKVILKKWWGGANEVKK